MEESYVIPGTTVYNCPPLYLDNSIPATGFPAGLAAELIDEVENILPVSENEEKLRRIQFDLGLRLDQCYHILTRYWNLGSNVLAWVDLCVAMFQDNPSLRPVLHTDIWPPVYKSGFVELLRSHHPQIHKLNTVRAVGLRHVFREIPPPEYFSPYFWLLLFNKFADTAYESWAGRAPSQVTLPKERFKIEVKIADWG